jgi:hypothetical protein
MYPQESKQSFLKASADMLACTERFCSVRKNDFPALLEVCACHP